jgi:hypothetical protein
MQGYRLLCVQGVRVEAMIGGIYFITTGEDRQNSSVIAAFMKPQRIVSTIACIFVSEDRGLMINSKSEIAEAICPE